MPVKNYDTVDGRLLGDRDPGNPSTTYFFDPSGTMTGAFFDGGADFSSFTPYGRGTEVAAFGWNGAWGYKPTGKSEASHYVRARSYSNTRGRWTSQDPLWPEESAYGYAGGEPVQRVDPSGKQVGCFAFPDCESWPGGPCSFVRTFFSAGGKDIPTAAIVCCKGKMTPCIIKDKTGRKGINECILKHEESHLNQVTCEGVGNPPLAVYIKPELKAQYECAAHAIEIACLLRNEKECKGDPLCKKQYTNEICNNCVAQILLYKCPNVHRICRERCPSVKPIL